MREVAISEKSKMSKRQSRRQSNLPSKFKVIDLFCGAGGLSLGFSKYFNNRFEHVWANDFDEAAVETFNHNLGNFCILGNIIDILRDKSVAIPKADVVIGGPPCQGFSLLNRNRESDERKQLWRPFLKVVERCGAKVFVMENVPQLLNSAEIMEIKEAGESLGFNITTAKLCAADYGVAQSRWRAFVLGCKEVDPKLFFPPIRTHAQAPELESNRLDTGNYEVQPWTTVREVISDLPRPLGTEIRDIDPPLDLHFGRKPTQMSRQRYRVVSKEGMNRFDLQRLAPELTPECWKRKKSGGTDLFGRLWWDRPAFTVRTEFFKPEKGRYLHPRQHRPITHREAARIQSFPDSFIFKGSKIEIARQIGNAVPPLLAARIADCVLECLLESNGG